MDYPRMNQWKQPLFPHPDTGEEQAWVRASTLAKAMDDGGGLINWAGAMVAAGAYLRPDLAGKLGARWPMTEDNKGEIYGLVEELKDAGGGSIGRNAGDTLHEMIRRINQGEKFRPMPPWATDVSAFQNLMQRHQISINPEYVERTVCCPEIGVAGSFDFLARKRGELFVADLKTGKLGDYVWPAWVVQLTVYASAAYLYDWDTGEFSPMPAVSRKRALVVSVPAGTGEAELYSVDIEPGVRAIKAALWVRDWRKQAKTLARKARLTTKASA